VRYISPTILMRTGLFTSSKNKIAYVEVKLGVRFPSTRSSRTQIQSSSMALLRKHLGVSAMANKVRLGDIARVKHGFAFSGQYFRDEPPGDVLVTPGNFNVGGGFNSDKAKFYNGPDVEDDYVLRAGDLIVTMTDLSKASDTLGFPAIVPLTSGPYRYLHNQRIGLLDIKSAKVDKRYLYYVMASPPYRAEILASATGTTVKHTSPRRIESFEFEIPSLQEQRAIAFILGALDDKIELNRKMRAILEAMARALFKSWFVDFDPVRTKAEVLDSRLAAEIAMLFPDTFDENGFPSAWRTSSVYEIADVIYGAAFASRFFNDQKTGHPLIRIRDLKHQAPTIYTSELHPRGYLAQPGDLLVGMDGEFRPYMWAGPRGWMNQRVCCFRPKSGVSRAYVHFSIEGLLAEVERSEAATTVIHIGKSDIDLFHVLQPPNNIMKCYADIADNLEQRQLVANEESRTLTYMRDSLLPKLISGELRVRDAERILEKSV
jgi:type I restriction enzyme, S subunit